MKNGAVKNLEPGFVQTILSLSCECKREREGESARGQNMKAFMDSRDVLKEFESV